MSSTTLSEPILISRPQELQRMIDTLLQAPLVAIDTESNSLFAYREQVCLIQFSIAQNERTGEQQDYLLDPLALPDLSGLGALFADPKIEKVFHAGEYDLICLKRDFGFKFVNLFDTMIAARILGRTSVGLAAILEQAFGVVLDKHYQRANWGARPLNPEMLGYARLDSHYLIPLRHMLCPELQAAGRWELAVEDFYRLCNVAVPELNGDMLWRVISGRETTPRQSAILQELCAFRDQQARRLNLPVFKVLGNDLLYDIARLCPQTRAALAEVEGMNPRLLDRFGNGLLEALQRGLTAKPVTRIHNARPDDAYLERLELLRNWRKKSAQTMHVESDVILPRDLMESIAQANPASLEDLGQLMVDFPWRFSHFGAEIYNLLRRKTNVLR